MAAGATGSKRSDGPALVTGAGSGIGAACARRLGTAGVPVLVADIDAEGAARVAAEIADAGGTALAHAADVGEPDDADAMVAAAVDAFGAVRLAVNSAGVGSPMRPLRATTPEAWRRVLRVNLDGVFHCLRAELEAMRPDGGAIVNVASVLGLAGAALVGPYVAAKHGVIGLTRTAALEGAADGIRVNAVAPGFIDTPMLQAGTPAPVQEALRGRIPAGRLGRAEEVAELVGWLLGDAAGYVTGACFTADGGFLAA